MAYRTVRWHCETCRKTFAGYDEARSCEVGHIVQHSIDRTQDAIQAAFSKSPVTVATLKTNKP